LFIEGQILFFQPFYFKNGDTPQDKFFIILKNVGNDSIVASLPTSKNNAPSLIDISHGCKNINERKFNCYVFERKRCICDNGFSFDLQTYVYGNQVDNFTAKSISLNSPSSQGIKYSVKGQLNNNEFNDLKKCIVSSNSIINRIKKLLQD